MSIMISQTLPLVKITEYIMQTQIRMQCLINDKDHTH